MSLRNWPHRPGYSYSDYEFGITDKLMGLECHCCHRVIRTAEGYVQRWHYAHARTHTCCSNANEGQILMRGDLPWSSKPPEGWRELVNYLRRFGDCDVEIATQALDQNYLYGMVVSPTRGGIGEPYVRAVTPTRIHRQMEELLVVQARRRILEL